MASDIPIPESSLGKAIRIVRIIKPIQHSTTPSNKRFVENLSNKVLLSDITNSSPASKFVVVAKTSLQNSDVVNNKFPLKDVTNTSLRQNLPQHSETSSKKCLVVNLPNNGALRDGTNSPTVSKCVVVAKTPLQNSEVNKTFSLKDVTNTSLGQNLPKIAVQQNFTSTSLQVSNPTNIATSSLRKIPNRQKSLSLQKNRSLSLAIRSKQICTVPSQPTQVLPEATQEIPAAAAPLVPQEQQVSKPSTETSPVILKDILEDMLPPNYSYHITSIEPLKVYHNQDYDESYMFMAEVRANIKSKVEALEWLKDYTTNTSTDWRVRRNFSENTKCIIFKKGYRCHNNTMAQYRKDKKSAHKKHTECVASVMITVKNFNMARSSDALLKSYPTEIVLHHCHNHPLEAADSLKHRRPSDDVRKKFEDFFRNGHSPSAALHTHQFDLQMESGDNFFKVLADGLYCPSLQWCYNLYRNNYNKAYGPPTGEGMLASLKAAVEVYNQECGSTCAVVEVIEETEIVVALCTPLMKRVHQLKSSSEMAFLDSGGMMDRQNNRVFTLLAYSAAGALPEGLIITSSESENAIYEGFKMLMSIVPPEAFGGRGILGPQIIMTDDQTSERNALRLIFPEVILLLCLFHVLQAMWRYIWDNKHKVDGKDKLEVYMLFREVCYELNEDEFKGKYELLLSHNLICKNSVLQKHLKDLYDRAPEWALSFRNDLLTRGNNTNNYSEATVRQLKDQVLQRLTAYSLVQLFDFFTTRLEAYFQRRLAMVLNGRQENYWKSKHFVRPSKLVPLRCEKTSHEDLYLVKNLNQNSEYIVDMFHEVCSCPVGRNGAPCKHQMAVVQHYNISSTQFLPVDLQSKLALHKVMTTVPPSAEWYTSLKAGPFVPSQISNIPDISSVYIEHQATPDDEALNMDLEGNSQSTDNAIVTFDPEKLSDALQKWEAINAHMVNALTSKPEVFVSAVEKFSSKFQKAKESSENQLASALHTFNQLGVSRRTVVRKYIYVNNVSIAKRKNAGGGRHMTQQGRPNGSIAKKKNAASGDCQVTRQGRPNGSIAKKKNAASGDCQVTRQGRLNGSITKKKNPALGGCQMTRQGRPPRSKQTAEHGYSHKVAVKEPAWNRIPSKRGPVPHDLSQKITEQNASKKPRHR